MSISIPYRMPPPPEPKRLKKLSGPAVWPNAMSCADRFIQSRPEIAYLHAKKSRSEWMSEQLKIDDSFCIENRMEIRISMKGRKPGNSYWRKLVSKFEHEILEPEEKDVKRFLMELNEQVSWALPDQPMFDRWIWLIFQEPKQPGMADIVHSEAELPWI